MTRQNPEHPWRTARFIDTREEDVQTPPNRAIILDLAFQQDIPALQQHMNNTEQT